jgi:2-isopropylmalate synthase
VGTTIQIYDTTLRDGCQAEDISLTIEDKLRVTERLDDFGISYVEGGWPGSNPRDEAYFREVRRLALKRVRVAAFGSTRRVGVTAGEDRNVEMLLRAETPVVTIFGKTWDLHVRDDLRIPESANLEIIHDTIRYLKTHVDEVIFDAEHFFDGHHHNPAYALECLTVAADAGADLLCLCDTNGGRLPDEIAAGVRAVAAVAPTPVGIHCHNDSDLAVANSLVAVREGAVQVQGTINGFGERCGNVNLCSVIANLQLKMGCEVVSDANLRRLQELSHFVYELANLEPYKRQPYVGQSAFAHKGGVHVAAVQRNPVTYEHVDPERVGNRQRVLVSDLSGRANILYKAKQFGVDVDTLDPHVRRLVEDGRRYFDLVQFRVVDEKGYMRLIFGEGGGFQIRTDERIEHDPASAWAAVMLAGPHGEIEHTAAEGNGPVNALDTALRRALIRFYPRVEEVRLLDYKVRVLGGTGGSAATVRVLIESGDGHERWGTVGVSHNVIEASWQALVDSFEYKLYKDEKRADAKKGKRKTRVEPRGRGRRAAAGRE